MKNTTIQKRLKRKNRVKNQIKSAVARVRLSVFRSNKYIYVSAINDKEGKTIAEANSKVIKTDKKGKKETAFEVGKLIGDKLNSLKIKKVVFDRNGYKYHGRVKAVADGARAAGLSF